MLIGPRDGLPEEATQWIKNNSSLKVADLASQCVRKLDRLLDNKSELNELWMENEEDYPKWKGCVIGLREDLAKYAESSPASSPTSEKPWWRFW